MSQSQSELLITPTPPSQQEDNITPNKQIFVQDIVFMEEEEEESYPTPTYQLERRSVNQYSNKETNRDIFNWLLDNCFIYQERDEKFVCWNTPTYEDGIRGFSFNKVRGEYDIRARINMSGKKMFAYVFSYDMHNQDNPSQEDGDIHHLCCNPRCFRPSHLIKISV